MADDPVYGMPLVASRMDDSRRRVKSRRLGPAGVAVARLASGLTLEVDAAEPAQLASIDVDVDIVDPEIVDELIGGGRRLVLASMVERSDQKPRRLPASSRGDGWSSRRSERPSSEPLPSDDAIAMGDVVFLMTFLQSTAKDSRFRLMAGLEGIVEAGRLDHRPALRELLQKQILLDLSAMLTEVDVSNEIIDQSAGLSEGERSEVDGVFATVIAAGVGDLERTLTAIRAAISEGRSEVDQQSEDLGKSSPITEERRRRVASPPQIQTTRFLEVNWLEIEFDRPGQDYWLRVVERPSQQLVTIVPITADKGRGVAGVLLSDADVDLTLEFDVTLTPLLPPTDPLGRVTEAVRRGFKAVDFDRRGFSEEASELWTRCAEIWSSLGDGARARLALKYATNGLPQSGRRFLAHRLDDSTHGGP